MPSNHKELAKICRDVRAGVATDGRIIDFREAAGRVWGLTQIDWQEPSTGAIKKVNCICPRATKTPLDLLEDADALKINDMHAGFLAAWSAIRDGALAVEWPVVFGAHSLGGAMATIGALDFHPDAVLEVVTFGSPRVGGPAFRDRYGPLAGRTTRYVHALDPIPWVPFWGMGFRHVKRSVWWDGSAWQDGVNFGAAVGLWLKGREGLKGLLSEHEITNYIDVAPESANALTPVA